MSQHMSLHARTKVFAGDNPWKSWWYILSSTFLLGLSTAGTTAPMADAPACHLQFDHGSFDGADVCHFFTTTSITPFCQKSRTGRVLPCAFTASGSSPPPPSGAVRMTTIIRTTPKLRSALHRLLPHHGPGSVSKILPRRAPHLPGPCAIRSRSLFGYFTIFLFGMVDFPRSPARRASISTPSSRSSCTPPPPRPRANVLTGPRCSCSPDPPPTLIGCALGSYLFYAQHNFPDVTFGDKNKAGYL